MEKPTIYLTLNKTERWNVQDFLKPSDSDETPFYGILDIANGHIVTKTPYGEWDFGLNGSVDGGVIRNLLLMRNCYMMKTLWNSRA